MERAEDVSVSYGEDPEQTAGVWWPRPTPEPFEEGTHLVVVVHGGFWRQRYNRSYVGPVCAALADLGYAAVAPEYRRVGGAGGWPATLDDMATIADRLPAVVGAAAMPTGLRLSPGHALVGHSAGGHLVLWAAGRHRLPEASPWHRGERDLALSGVVGLAPVADLRTAALEGVGDGAPQALVGAEPDRLPGRWEQADPSRLLPTGVPTVLVHGADDESVPTAQSVAYADAARDAGDVPDLRVLRGVRHMELFEPGSGAWPDVVEALGTVLPPPVR